MDGIWNRYNLKSTGRIYTFPQIETFEQETVNRVIFMQDGAPPHFSCFVPDVLNERFPDAWIGRGGPIPWPPRSPDLSPLHFSLWRYIKNSVYAEKIRNIQQLQERITSAIETVTRDMIQKTWQEIEFRLDVSRATNGAHTEMYWGKSKTLNFSEHFKTQNV